MNNNLVIGVILAVMAIVGAVLFFNKQATQPSSSEGASMQGASMPGMDHSKMQMGQ